MDPDQCLEEIRLFISKQQNPSIHTTHFTKYEELRALANRVEALDRWLTSGGYPPKEWQHY